MRYTKFLSETPYIVLIVVRKREMIKKIILFSKDACVQCNATKRAFTKIGVLVSEQYHNWKNGVVSCRDDNCEDKNCPCKTNSVAVINAEKNADANAYCKAQGVTAVPFVEILLENGEKISWAGFRPDKVKALAKELTSVPA